MERDDGQEPCTTGATTLVIENRVGTAALRCQLRTYSFGRYDAAAGKAPGLGAFDRAWCHILLRLRSVYLELDFRRVRAAGPRSANDRLQGSAPRWFLRQPE